MQQSKCVMTHSRPNCRAEICGSSIGLRVAGDMRESCIQVEHYASMNDVTVEVYTVAVIRTGIMCISTILQFIQ